MQSCTWSLRVFMTYDGTYTIVGIYSADAGIVDDYHTLHPNTVIIPTSILNGAHYSIALQELEVSFLLPNGGIEAFEAELASYGFGELLEYYDSGYLYEGDPDSRVLIAEIGNEVVGALMVDCSESGIGTIGCMAVKTAYRGRRIATHLTILATKYLRDRGMKEAFLSYTYSGLDRLYGAAGYKINVYYMMAKKKF